MLAFSKILNSTFFIGAAIDPLFIALAVIGLIFIVGFAALLVRCYRKVEQGSALIRNGIGGPKVSFAGSLVIPVLHRMELMDISVKRVEIARETEDGLVCKDNMRADIRVAFFVRVNKTPQDVLRVAQALGCSRASDRNELRQFFDAKFSEALKTVGKKFDFVELYESRQQFKDEILETIGTDLNGYILDDAAIDYLEQTSLDRLNPNNILDAEGIKKITELTAIQAIHANEIDRDREKTIKQQDVEAREAILELEKQQAEAEEKQKREIAMIEAREVAAAETVAHEERLKSENARISTDEEIEIAEQNKLRQVLVASKNKERTDAVETERVEKDRALEATERERIVELAQIEKEKALEVERKLIQDTIRERVIVERTVVEEQERIKDTHEHATAERAKHVALTDATAKAEENKIAQVVAAQAAQEAADRLAKQRIIEAEAEREAASKESQGRKLLAEALAAESAAVGLSEAQVIEAKADAEEKHGLAEALVLKQKSLSEAEGIEAKAEAMKLLGEASQEHEEYRLRLAHDLEVELAAFDTRKDIASRQAEVLGVALQDAKIDIVGGDNIFFDKLMNSIAGGKSVDRFVEGSRTLTDVKDTFFAGDNSFKENLRDFIGKFGLSSEDVKNLSVTALVTKLMTMSKSNDDKGMLQNLLGLAKSAGLSEELVGKLGIFPPKA